MPRLIEIKRAQDVLSVYWTLTDFCNFRCNYCPDSLHSGDYTSGRKPGYPTDDEIRVFLDRLINIHAKGKFLQVCISGGEPTLHPMYGEIIDTLYPHGIVETVSNGSRSIEWWKGLKHLPDKVTMSLHAGWTKMDKVNELGEFLLDNNTHVAFNMMCDPGQWHLVQEMYQQLTPRLQSFVNAKLISDHSGGVTDGQPWEYQADQMEYIKGITSRVDQPERRFDNVDFGSVLVYDDETKTRLQNTFDLINTNQHRFKEWECSAGSEGIAVNFDGWAYAANCRSHKMGKIDKFQLYKDPIMCTRHWCKCAADIYLTKKKPTWLQDQ